MSHMGFSLRDLSLGTLKRKLSPNKHANNAKKDEENSLPSGVSGRSELGRDRISSKVSINTLKILYEHKRVNWPEGQ